MDIPSHVISLYLLFFFQTLFVVSTFFLDCPARVESYAKHVWLYLLFFTVGEMLSFSLATAVLAIISFIGLREFYSLIAIRPGDRFGIWGGFLSIPLMILTLLLHNHLLFILVMPLYAFFLITFLVGMGGDTSDGIVFSVGAIGFGLFLFVFGNGLLGFLTLNNIWLGLIVLINVSFSDAIAFCLYSTGQRIFTGKIIQYLAAIPITLTASILMSDWTFLSLRDSIVVGTAIPVLVAVSRFIIFHIESDLGIAQDYNSLRRGRLINSSCSLLLVAPIIFYSLNYLL
jgi:phosphatidate cytidylyltransferase